MVSIIVPCYNQAKYLDECLQSVLDQTYTSWECIIVNDGSPDGTEEVAKNWLDKDNRFKYIDRENGGVSAARNTGIFEAKGNFILPLDGDDYISNDYLSLAVKEFKENENLKLVYCKAEKFGTVNGEWNLESFSLEKIAIANMIFCSAMFKKEDWFKVGGYDEKMIYGIEDWEFWIHLLKEGGQVHQINKVCFYYRVKISSRSTNLDKEKIQRKEMVKYINIKHADFYIKCFGTFQKMIDEKKGMKAKLESKKYVLKLFLKTFLKIN